MAVNRIYCATGLGDGDGTTVEGDLDSIDAGDLADKDMAIVCDQTNFYFYVLDADSAAAHSLPDVVQPGGTSTDKRWILQSIKVNDITISDDVVLVADDIAIGGQLWVKCENDSVVLIGENDVQNGEMYIYGGATIGADMRFHTAADSDDNIEYYRYYVNGESLNIGTDVDTDIIKLDVNKDLWLTDGDLNIQNASDGVAKITLGVQDNHRGAISLYGSATGNSTGGGAFCYTADDYNDTISYYAFYAAADDFQIGPDTDFDLFRITAEKDVYITDGDLIIRNPSDDVASISIGNSGSHRGRVLVYGEDTGSGVGGGFQLYLADDYDDSIEYYLFQATNDDLYIGPNSDSDALIYNGTTNQWIASAAGGFDIDGALTAGTVDADTDFTVGGLVITDGQLTDTGQLVINTVSGVNMTGSGALHAGVDDTTRGLLYLYGTAASSPVLTMYVPGDDDGNGTDAFQIAFATGTDDAILGLDNDTDMLKFIGGGTPSLEATVGFLGTTIDASTDFTVGDTVITNGVITDTTGLSIAADITLSDAGKVEWDPSPASDETMSGDIISQTVDANASGIGAVLYKAADGNWEEADASSSTTMGMLGIAVESGTGTKDVLLRGFVKDTAWTWTPGQQLFVSETTGDITATAPTTSASIVQVAGWAMEATVMYFNPSPDYLEVA